MDTIQIKDKLFTVSIREQEIQKEVIRVANEINRDLAGKNPLFLSVLNGSFMFTADLLKHISIPCEISFVKLASYQGVSYCGYGTDYAASAGNIGNTRTKRNSYCFVAGETG